MTLKGRSFTRGGSKLRDTEQILFFAVRLAFIRTIPALLLTGCEPGNASIHTFTLTLTKEVKHQMHWSGTTTTNKTETDAPLPTSHFTEMKFQIRVLETNSCFEEQLDPYPPSCSVKQCLPAQNCLLHWLFNFFLLEWPTGTFSLKELCSCHVPGCLESVPLDTVSRSRCGPHASNPNWCSAYYIPNHRILHWIHISLQSEACLKWFFSQELWGIGKNTFN